MKEATLEQIEAWKKEFIDVYSLFLEDKVCYLKKPTMLNWKKAFTILQDEGENEFALSLLNSCWIYGDEEIKTDDNYFLSAKEKLTILFEYNDAEITKLKDCYKITINGKSCTVKPISRQFLDISERKNPANKPFVTSEKLFDLIKIKSDKEFNDKKDAEFRFPLYKAIEKLQKQKVTIVKKL